MADTGAASGLISGMAGDRFIALSFIRAEWAMNQYSFVSLNVAVRNVGHKKALRHCRYVP